MHVPHTTALRATAAAAVLAAAAALSACSSSGSPTAPATGPVSSPTVTSTPTVTDQSGYLALPLDAYGFAGNDTDTIQRALGILEQRCMAAKGFGDWRAPASSGPTRPTSYDDYPVRPASVADATASGYRKPAPKASQITAGLPKTGSDAELAALLGYVPSKDARPSDPLGGGCSKDAFVQLTQGRPSANQDLVGQLQTTASSRAGADTRVLAAQRAWSACMKQSGFTFDSPQQAMNSNWSGKQAGSQEIATATADLRCRTQTNLVGVWVAVVSGYEQQLISQNSTQLQAVRTSLDFEVRHASQIVASAPTG